MKLEKLQWGTYRLTIGRLVVMLDKGDAYNHWMVTIQYKKKGA